MATETTQWLRGPTALAKDPDWVIKAHMADHYHL